MVADMLSSQFGMVWCGFVGICVIWGIQKRL